MMHCKNGIDYHFMERVVLRMRAGAHFPSVELVILRVVATVAVHARNHAVIVAVDSPVSIPGLHVLALSLLWR